ncbi:hypothetical protein LEP1GSC192_0647 [Leptospira sp. B5-022]|nr:hypothetical protein LEP1GSC192_0647 [Leptospira sp. B5-022]
MYPSISCFYKIRVQSVFGYNHYKINRKYYPFIGFFPDYFPFIFRFIKIK